MKHNRNFRYSQNTPAFIKAMLSFLGFRPKSRRKYPNRPKWLQEYMQEKAQITRDQRAYKRLAAVKSGGMNGAD